MGKRDKKADSANGSRSHGWTPKGGKGGSGLTPEQTAALQTVADEKLRAQEAAERHQVAKEAAKEVRRADKRKKKKKRKNTSSDSDSDTGSVR